MTRRQPCGICGDFDHLEVECYLAEHGPEDDVCLGCDKPFNSDGYCPRCEEYRFGTVCQGDPLPMKHRKAA